uniref:Uncharacterized protein n=1 Tax=Ovis aries TaxID=9940 RepID=A0AC11EB63_SHEEP
MSLGAKTGSGVEKKGGWRNLDPRRRGPTAKLSPPGWREHPMGYKSALEGQVRVVVFFFFFFFFFEESRMGTAVTLALETDFPRAVLSQKLHCAGPSPENPLQRVFPFIVNPEPHGS